MIPSEKDWWSRYSWRLEQLMIAWEVGGLAKLPADIAEELRMDARAWAGPLPARVGRHWST